MSYVDDGEYEAGKAAFRAGKDLREIVERLQQTDAVPYSVQQERKDLSFAVGFVDGFLALVRSRKVEAITDAKARGVLT